MAWGTRKSSVAPIPTSEEPKEWDYFDYGELQHSKDSAVCMTCEHFTSGSTKSCVTLLTCPIHRKLIQQGEHLTKRCKNCERSVSLKLDGAQKLLSQDIPTLCFQSIARCVKRYKRFVPKQSSEERPMPVGSVFFCVTTRYFFQLNPYLRGVELDQELKHDGSKNKYLTQRG